jgi:hypothetical protein
MPKRKSEAPDYEADAIERALSHQTCLRVDTVQRLFGRFPVNGPVAVAYVSDFEDANASIKHVAIIKCKKVSMAIYNCAHAMVSEQGKDDTNDESGWMREPEKIDVQCLEHKMDDSAWHVRDTVGVVSLYTTVDDDVEPFSNARNLQKDKVLKDVQLCILNEGSPEHP